MIEQIPKNVFLDTTVVNFILDYGEQIQDGVPISDDITDRVRRDIEALRDIWLTGQRAAWRLTISPTTIAEVQRTRDERRLQDLLGWVSSCGLIPRSTHWRLTATRDLRMGRG